MPDEEHVTVRSCPLCGGQLSKQSGARPIGARAYRYEDCVRICASCAIGLSNSRTKPACIWREREDRLWNRSSASRLTAVMNKALNKRNRENKVRRLGHEHSEDMLTWNVFSWIEDHCLPRATEFLAGCVASGSARIYYWGANDRDIAWTPCFAGFLIRRFQERRGSLSEPDIIIETDRTVAFVEVKFLSRNERGQRIRDSYLTGDWIVSETAMRVAGM